MTDMAFVDRAPRQLRLVLIGAVAMGLIYEVGEEAEFDILMALASK